MDDESLDSLVLVRTGAAINEGASQPRRRVFVSVVFSSFLFFYFWKEAALLSEPEIDNVKVFVR